MDIGTKLRQIRQQKGLSQGDVEHASGLLRCYISRVEHGHSKPSLETLERFAAALDVPLYGLFYSGNGVPTTKNLRSRPSLEELAGAPDPSGGEAKYLLEFRDLVGRMRPPERVFLLDFARKLATP